MGLALKPTVAALGTLCVVLFVALLFKGCGGGRAPLIPPATQHTLDSLRATAETAARSRDSALTVIKHDTLIAVRVERRVDTLRVRDTVLQRRVDSLAVIAAAHPDSAPLWRSAYDAARVQIDTLHAALAAADTAIVHERAARITAQDLYANTARRLTVTEQANAQLEAALKRAVPACKVLGLIPCPNRTVAFVAGGILGVAGSILVTSGGR